MVSRVARIPIVVPKDVTVQLQDHSITVKGKNGVLSQSIPKVVLVEHVDGKLSFALANDEIETNALAGTMRAQIANMIEGVSKGVSRKLQLVGVGYRAKEQGQKELELAVGFSHPVKMTMPEGVTVETPTQTEILLKGMDKQKVAQVAANIRRIRPPEPYKGKGIRYVDEQIILKEVKKK